MNNNTEIAFVALNKRVNELVQRQLDLEQEVQGLRSIISNCPHIY